MEPLFLSLRPGAEQDPLSEEEWESVQLRLWNLLKKRTRRFTMGDSTSVPAETAQELLSSICFTLQTLLDEENMPIRALLTQDMDLLFRRGVALLEQKMDQTEGLWKMACLLGEGLESQSLRDTLKSIGEFRKRYRYHYFAHQVPCDVDYQLCLPVAESLGGILYLMEYLRRVAAECALLRRIPTPEVSRILEGVLPDYRDTVLNLWNPVLDAALRTRLPKPLLGQNKEEAQERLGVAAKELCCQLGVLDPFTVDYTVRCAVEEILPRLR